MMNTGSPESSRMPVQELGSGPEALSATSAREADDRLGVARKAQHEWGGLSTAERVRVLEALPLILASNLDRIVDVIHEENGKPRSEAMAHEAVPALALARHHLEHTVATLAPREIALPYLPHRKAMRHHRPYGVVVAIAPWNFPFLIPFSQVLPSLFAGNAVVLKPSELTPRVGRLLVDLVNQCGLPDGALQLADGDRSLGASLVDARPDKVLFTGSVATGRKVMAAAARFPIPVALELGGVDAMVVLDDADLEFAAAAIAWGVTFNGGQACCSVERLIVHSSIQDALMARVADKMRRIDVRHDLGPAIDDRQLEIWARHVDAARCAGLDVDCGGERVGNRRYAPTLVSGVGVLESQVWNEETFGPVAAVVPFDTDEEAIELHNQTRYGLTASIISADIARAQQIALRLNAGGVAINEVASTLYSSPEIPWGGVGESGFGRSHGTDALLDAAWVQVVEVPRGPVFGPKRPWWYPYGPELEDAMKELGRVFVAPGPAGRLRGYGRAGRQILNMLSRNPRI